MKRRSDKFIGGTILLMGVSAVALSPMTVGIAVAQDQADRGAIEEIVVTAQKRGSQRLQDVPMAISAIGGRQLQDMGATNFMDYAGMIPSLQFQDLGPGDKEYIIRGANSSGGSTAGVYFDEAVITGRNKEDGGGRQPDIKLYDIERIEVLKGPQGTLYGASSMTGTIRIITNKPDASTFAGYAEAELSTTRKGGENYNFNGWLNLPIVRDKLAVRVVGWVNDNSGFIDQVRLDNDNINTENVQGGRATLRWFASEDVTVTAGIVAQSVSAGGSSRYTPGSDFFAGTPPIGFVETTGCDLCNVDFTKSPWEEDLQIYHGTVEWDTGNGQLLATSNFFTRDIDFQFDGTPILFFLFDDAGASPANNFFGLGTIPNSITRQPQSREQWTNEIRFASDLDSPFNFVAGAFMSRETKDFEVQVTTANSLGEIGGLFDPEDPNSDLFAGGPTIFGRTRLISMDQEALFADGTYAVSEQLEVSAGVRWFQTRIDSFEEQTKPFGGFPPASGPVINSVSANFNAVTFRAGINYRPSDDQLVYISVAEGFREGGVNDFGIPQIGGIPQTFGSDDLISYEIGFKSSFMDRRLTLNMAVYHTDWNNLLVEIRDRTEAFKFLGDGGDAKIDGIEAELTANLVSGLTISANAAYTNARLNRSSPFAAGVPDPADPANPFRDPNAGIAGDDIPNIPDFQFGLFGSYDFPLMNGEAEGRFIFNWTYNGKRFNQFRPIQVDANEVETGAPNPFRTQLDSYNIINAAFSVLRDGWQTTLFLDNLTDSRAQIDAIRSNQDPLAFLTIRPRTIGIRVSKDFGG